MTITLYIYFVHERMRKINEKTIIYQFEDLQQDHQFFQLTLLENQPLRSKITNHQEGSVLQQYWCPLSWCLTRLAHWNSLHTENITILCCYLKPITLNQSVDAINQEISELNSDAAVTLPYVLRRHSPVSPPSVYKYPHLHLGPNLCWKTTLFSNQLLTNRKAS